MTRRCLEIISRHGYGVALLTKSDRILEPHVCPTGRRLEVLAEMQKRNIPTIVWLSPVLPFINDTEENIRSILAACIKAGVKGIVCFGMGLTLRQGSREYFYAALDKHFPGMKKRYMERYGQAYVRMSERHPALQSLFAKTCKEHGILFAPDDCFRYMQDFPAGQEQLSLFDNL